MQWTAGHSLHNSKYTIEQVLGGGGFGITYRARDNSSNRLVAIKTLNPWIQEQPDFAKHQERFIQEAFRLARCNHPNIIKVYDISQEEYLWYIVNIVKSDLVFRFKKNFGNKLVVGLVILTNFN